MNGEGNQYAIWVGLFVSLVMVAVSPNPAWMMIAVVGIGANGLAIAANGWKMPVWGGSEETIRHVPMGMLTRNKWLSDIIPTGVGKASIGDFLICAGLLGEFSTRMSLPYEKIIALVCLVWWCSGWVRGFDLFQKWNTEARKDARKNFPIMVLLLVLGNLFHVHGCGAADVEASVAKLGKAIAPVEMVKKNPPAKDKWRSLGKLAAPPTEIMKKLREDTAMQDKKDSQDSALKAVAMFTNPSAITFLHPSISAKGSRKGPFCRVTCATHHGGQYDVETAPELCRANWIPPTAYFIPGWIAISDKEEANNAWPGPASDPTEKTFLYWSSLQSHAIVLHASNLERNQP